MKSTMQKIFLVYIGFGLGMGLIFPFYANLFVEWKEGMLLFFVIGCFVAGTIVGLSNYFIFKKMLVNFIYKFSKTSKDNIGVELSKKDSHVDLYDSVVDNFDALILRLKKYMDEMKTISGNLLSQSNSLKEKNVNVLNNVDMIDKTFLKIQDDAKKESMSLGKVNENVDEFVKSAVDINKKALDSNKNNESAMEIINSAVSNSESASTEVNNVTNTIEYSKEIINTMSEKISEMDSMIGLIKDISDQTNLLALNAAIEAARAGEAGKGFAVVAEEVRKLADESNKTSEKISEMISDVKESAQNANNDLNNKNENIKKSAEVIINALGYLSKVGDIAKNSATNISSISELSISQNEKSRSIKNEVENITKISGDNLNGILNTSKMLKDISSNISELNKTSDQLNEIVMLLNKMNESSSF